MQQVQYQGPSYDWLTDRLTDWPMCVWTGETEDIQIPSVYVAQYEFRELQAIGDQPVQLIKNKEIRW